MSEGVVTLRHKEIVHQVLKDFFNGHALRNVKEVKEACSRLFERRALDPVRKDHLNEMITFEGLHFFKRDPAELEERPYTERARPRSIAEGSKAHYTAAEKNYAQKILKVLGEKTSVNLLKQENIDRVVSMFKELYSNIFGNEVHRTDKAIAALIRREQKRIDYGFTRPHKSICDDDVRDAKKLKNLRRLVLRRIKQVEDEQPFIL